MNDVSCPYWMFSILKENPMWSDGEHAFFKRGVDEI